jgi:hypothetical protein
VYASITWFDEDGAHHHRLSEIDKTFDSEENAAGFGFLIARAWIGENL